MDRDESTTFSLDDYKDNFRPLIANVNASNPSNVDHFCSPARSLEEDHAMLRSRGRHHEHRKQSQGGRSYDGKTSILNLERNLCCSDLPQIVFLVERVTCFLGIEEGKSTNNGATANREF